jgi:Histidinol-phosphate/aromatic aminotransferase and cobyric acid decarboxylase
MNPDAVTNVDHVPHGGSEDTSRLDFSANTNPNRPPGVAEVYESALSDATQYTDDFSAFAQAAASYVNCDSSMVTPMPGGIAALRLAIAVTVSAGDRVFIPEPGFSEYAREVKLQGGTPVGMHTMQSLLLTQHQMMLLQ